MSAVDPVKNHKSYTHSKQDFSNRRVKKYSNSTVKKYSHQQLLSIFKPSRIPNLAVPEAVDLILSRKSIPPVHRPNHSFSHNLGSDVNPRRHVKQAKEEEIPEWFDSELPNNSSQFKSDNEKQITDFVKLSEITAEENKTQLKFFLRPGAKIRNLLENIQGLSLDSPEEDSDYSNYDKKYEASVKTDLYDENEQTQIWSDVNLQNDYLCSPNDSFKQLEFVPLDLLKYPADLLQGQIKEGDPFAMTILNSGSMDELGYIILFPGSKPYERVWHYKDPHNNTQGPFCTLEMYNWNLGGFFSPDLLISLNSKEHFVPLKMFMMQQRMALSGIPMFNEYPAPVMTMNPPVNTSVPVPVPMPMPKPKTESCIEATFKMKSLLGII